MNDHRELIAERVQSLRADGLRTAKGLVPNRRVRPSRRHHSH